MVKKKNVKGYWRKKYVIKNMKFDCANHLKTTKIVSILFA